MFCGTGSFSHVDDGAWSAPSTPKGSRRRREKNPYATRGLDKFSTVLAELEARREKILAAVGERGEPMVRFMYSNTQDWVPIVVRLRDDKKPDSAKQGAGKKPLPEVERDSETPAVEPASGKDVAKTETSSSSVAAVAAEKRKLKKSFSWRVGWRACYYWPVVMVVILLCLVMFGRVFAICCTSIWWYLVPTMQAGSGDHRRRSMKKDFGRRLSDKRLGVGVGVGVGANSGNIGAGTAPSSQAKKGGGVQEISSPRKRV